MAIESNVASNDPVDRTTSGNAVQEGSYVQARVRQNGTEVIRPAQISDGRRKPQQSANSPEMRVKTRTLWQKAIEVAERIRCSANGDRNDMFGAAVLLEDTFSQMWELRESRDENWVGILDLAQTVLKALAKSEIESATPDQCWHLLQLVELHLSPSTKTVEDLDAAVRLVTDLNLTPYEGLEPLADA